MKPVVSIVIPTYQRPSLLVKCLEALQRQQFPPEQMEVIVVTDGPDPVTRSAVENRPWENLRLSLYSLSHKKGPAAARNLGWKAAEGPLILFTDDDCIPDSGWVAACYAAFGTETGLSLAFTGRVLVPRTNPPTDYDNNIARLETACFITANCACTKAALEQVNGFDENFSMAWREDSDLEFKLIQQGIPIRNVPQALVTHPVRKAEWGVSIREQRKSMFNALLYKKYPSLYREKIRKYPLWNYYGIIILFLLFLAAGIGQQYGMAAIAFTGWGILVTAFIKKRLTGTVHTAAHVSEMIVTSLIIPFLSVFWTLYGSAKFKTLLL